MEVREGEEDPPFGMWRLLKPNHDQKEGPMEGGHEFNFEASGGLKNLQDLATQRLLLSR